MLIAGFAIAVYTIFILLSDTDILYLNFKNMNNQFIIVALLLFSLGFFLRSIRWVIMLKYTKITVPTKKAIFIYFTGYAFLITPGRFGEAIRSQYLKNIYTIPLSKTVSTVFAERYYDVVATIILALLVYGISESQSHFIFFSIVFLIIFYSTTLRFRRPRSGA